MINLEEEMGYWDWKTKTVSKSFPSLFFLEVLYFLPAFIMKKKINSCFFQSESCVNQSFIFAGIKVQKHLGCLTKRLKIYQIMTAWVNKWADQDMFVWHLWIYSNI